MSEGDAFQPLRVTKVLLLSSHLSAQNLLSSCPSDLSPNSSLLFRLSHNPVQRIFIILSPSMPYSPRHGSPPVFLREFQISHTLLPAHPCTWASFCLKCPLLHVYRPISAPFPPRRLPSPTQARLLLPQGFVLCTCLTGKDLIPVLQLLCVPSWRPVPSFRVRT